MSLLCNRPAYRAITGLVCAALAASLPASAGSRNAAPIRYGHSVSQASTQPVVQLASASTARHSASGSLFAYPDEPLPAGYGHSRPAPPMRQAQNQSPSNPPASLPTITPEEYAEYVKIGGAYTINGVTYTPEMDPFYNATGTASWYGPGFDGGLTANGEIYDMHALTAAHPTLPLPCFVEVTNLSTGEKVTVRVNDRGPFAKNRIIDLSYAAASRISVVEPGSAEVRVKYLGPAPRDPSDVRPAPRPEILQAELELPRVDMQSHFVQLGSFRDRDNARTLLSRVSGVRDDGDVVSARVNGSSYYRVVLGPFASKDEAENQRITMARNGFDGLVIQNP